MTHGLHSNLGADMLFMKESIDAAARQAKVDAKARRAREKADREAERERDPGEDRESGLTNLREGHADENVVVDADADEDEDDDEEVVVRGFSGNATRTERGIKYLGKRLARFILSMTYPDQPFLPITKTTTASLVDAFKSDANGKDGKPAHKGSSIHEGGLHAHPERAFQITSISFIGHSLGGLHLDFERRPSLEEKVVLLHFHMPIVPLEQEATHYAKHLPTRDARLHLDRREAETGERLHFAFT